MRRKVPDFDDLPNLRIYAFSEGKELDLPLADLPVDVAFSFERLLEGTDTSFFYSDENQNLVVIRVTEETEFVLKDNISLRGLLGHELVHALQKYRGLDNDLRRCYSLVMGEMAPLLDELKYKKAPLSLLLKEIGMTSILVLKDLYVDDELVHRGLTREILTYYSKLFLVKKTCPIVRFEKIREGRRILEKDFPAVIDALTFELELMPTWLPFERTHSKLASRLKSHIETCYESDLGWIAKDFHEVIVLYLTEFSNTCKFHQDFYRLVLDRVYAVLAGIDQFSFHMREALARMQSKKMDPQARYVLSSLVKALYLHVRDKRDLRSLREKTELEEWIYKRSGKLQFHEFMTSGISKTDLLKVPILWCVSMARREYAESPRSDCIDIAYSCVEAGVEGGDDPVFRQASLILTRLDVLSPYRLASDLLGLEFMFESDIFGRAPRPKTAVRLMENLKQKGILPDNRAVPVAKEVISLTHRSGNRTPRQLALLYTGLLKLSKQQWPLIEASLLALGKKPGFIQDVWEEASGLFKQRSSRPAARSR